MRLQFSLLFGAATLALMFTAAAVGCLCAAMGLALMQVMSPVVAAIGAAGAAFVTAAAVAIVGFVLARHPRKKRAIVDGNAIAAELGVLLGQQVRSLAAAHPKGTALGSLLMGFAVGADPALRRALRDLLQ